MLKVHTRNLGNVAVVGLQGRIVNGETAPLREAIYAQSSTSSIVLDMARVTAVDAGGLGMLLELRRHAEANGVGLKLMNVSRFVRQILEITRLDSVFEIIPKAEPLPALAVSRPARMGYAACA
jgi:anti-sigma B factor antagonist